MAGDRNLWEGRGCYHKNENKVSHSFLYFLCFVCYVSIVSFYVCLYFELEYGKMEKQLLRSPFSLAASLSLVLKMTSPSSYDITAVKRKTQVTIDSRAFKLHSASFFFSCSFPFLFLFFIYLFLFVLNLMV